MWQATIELNTFMIFVKIVKEPQILKNGRY